MKGFEDEDAPGLTDEQRELIATVKRMAAAHPELRGRGFYSEEVAREIGWDNERVIRVLFEVGLPLSGGSDAAN